MRQIPNAMRLTLLSSIGSGLEYYSFVTYVMLVPYLSQLFFPSSSPHAAMAATLLVFAIGYIATPIGGISFSWLGDRLGRKKSFLLAILLMAVADIAIGLLPTAISIGFSATIALTLLRFCQGLAQSAELPGAITFISEHANDKDRGRQCGLLFLGVGLGAGLSSLVNFMVVHLCSNTQMLAFGWRIPFLLGGVLAFIGFILRRYAKETPLFEAHKAKIIKVPLWSLLRTQPMQILQGVGIMIFPACLVTFGLYLPTYLQQYFNYPLSTVYLAMTFGFVLSAFFLHLFGSLSDKNGRRSMLAQSITTSFVLITCLFLGLYGHAKDFLFIFMLLYYVAITSMAACYPVMLAETFATPVRYTGVASSYTSSYMLAGFFPLAVSHLLSVHHSPLLVLALFAIMAVISFISTLRFQDKTCAALA